LLGLIGDARVRGESSARVSRSEIYQLKESRSCHIHISSFSAKTSVQAAKKMKLFQAVPSMLKRCMTDNERNDKAMNRAHRGADSPASMSQRGSKGTMPHTSTPVNKTSNRDAAAQSKGGAAFSPHDARPDTSQAQTALQAAEGRKKQNQTQEEEEHRKTDMHAPSRPNLNHDQTYSASRQNLGHGRGLLHKGRGSGIPE
jgi:hypothetical protein